MVWPASSVKCKAPYVSILYKTDKELLRKGPVKGSQIDRHLCAHTHQVPDVSGQPIDVRTNTADQVKMLRFAFSFANQVHHETGGDKGQREHHTYGHKNVYNAVVTGKE